MLKRPLAVAGLAAALLIGVASLFDGALSQLSNPFLGLLPGNNLSDVSSTSTARTNLGLGTAATKDVGTSANNVVQLDGSGKLPAVDGSALTNVSGGGGCTVSGSSGQVVTDDGSSGCDSNADMTFATGILSLGTDTSERGGVKMFGSTSGNITMRAPAAAGTNSVLTLPGATFDFSASGGSNQVVQQTSSGGAFSVGQLGFSNLSGSNSIAQLGGSGASHGALIDVAGTATWKVVPDCTDTGGNHINYTQSTDAFSCGTSGSGASLSANNTWTAGQAITPDTATSCGTQSAAGTLTPNLANSNSCVATFGAGNFAIANPIGVIAGQTYTLVLIQDGTGSRTISSWGNQWFFSNGTAPTLSTAAGAIDVLTCYWGTTSQGLCALALQGAAHT